MDSDYKKTAGYNVAPKLTKERNTMTEAEKDIIQLFAAGDQSLKNQAIAIHRYYCYTAGKARGTPEMDFMAEVDNTCPDLFLRSTYRRKLLEGQK